MTESARKLLPEHNFDPNDIDTLEQEIDLVVRCPTANLSGTHYKDVIKPGSKMGINIV